MAVPGAEGGTDCDTEYVGLLEELTDGDTELLGDTFGVTVVVP